MATLKPRVSEGTEEYQDGRTCVREYYVDGTLTSYQTPVKGTAYLAGGNWPTGGYRVNNWKLSGIVRSGSVQTHILTVWGSTWEGLAGGASSIAASVDKEMSYEQITITPDMMGARRAELDDTGYRMTKDGYRKHEPDWRTPVPGGGYARLGHYVYNNADSGYYMNSNGEWTSGSVATYGSPVAERCPFAQESGEIPLTLGMIGMTYQMKIHNVTYYVRTNSTYSAHAPEVMNDGRVTDWGPLSGRKYGPMTAATPATSGEWRCLGQTVRSAKDEDGTPLLQITRRFMRCPEGLGAPLRWNSDIYPVWSADWP